MLFFIQKKMYICIRIYHSNNRVQPTLYTERMVLPFLRTCYSRCSNSSRNSSNKFTTSCKIPSIKHSSTTTSIVTKYICTNSIPVVRQAASTRFLSLNMQTKTIMTTNIAANTTSQSTTNAKRSTQTSEVGTCTSTITESLSSPASSSALASSSDEEQSESTSGYGKRKGGGREGISVC